MAGFNGTGTFVRTYSWANDKANGINITASRFDTEDNGFATGLSTVICKDGQTTTTARIPMAVGISAAAGSASSPMVAPTGDLTTGIYSSASGSIDVASVGTRVGGFNANGLDNTVIGAGTPLAGSFTALTATSIAGITAFNKVTLTAPATGSTLTIADGKTLTANHTFTINGGDAAVLAIAASKTLTVSNTMTLAGGDSTSMTFPNTTDTVVTLAASQTLTNKTLTSPTITTGALGSSTATTQTALDNSTKVATTAYTDAAVSAGGGVVLLATVNASVAASVAFTSTNITSTYKKYIVEIDSLYTSDAGEVVMTISTNNGGAYLSSNYNYSGTAVGSNNAGTNITGISTASLSDGAKLRIGLGKVTSSTSTQVSQGTIEFSNPSASQNFNADWKMMLFDGTNSYDVRGSGNNIGTTAINNIKFADVGGGNITGNFHLYGIRGT